MAATDYAFLGATGQMQPNAAFEIVHKYSDKSLQLDSSLSAGYAAKGSAYLLYDWKWKQAYDSLLRAIEKKAVEIFELIHRLVKHPLKGLTPLGCGYAQLGEAEKAVECIRKIEQRQVEEPGVVLDADLAMIWWSLGDKDKAFHHLSQCVEKRMGPVAMLIDHPMFKKMADDPRCFLLKEQLNLVEYT